MFKKLACIAGGLLLCLNTLGCSRMTIEDFTDKQPAIDPFEFFSGSVTGYGYFYDRWGAIKTSFTVHLTGTQKSESEFIIDEKLVYGSGESSTRTFILTKTGDNTYTVACKDFTEPGSITAAGNALLWRYSLIQDTGSRTVTLRFTDWMFLQTNRLLLNRAYAYWYGIYVGEVFMVVEKGESSDER